MALPTLPQLLQAVENRPSVVVLAFVAILLIELYSLFEKSQRLLTPFFASEQQITFQSWVDYAASRCAFILLFFQLRNSNPKFYGELNIFAWAMVGYLVDYFIFYNNAFARVHVFGLEIPISYTLFMITLLSVIVLKTVWKWR